jgi:hypothetical protein
MRNIFSEITKNIKTKTVDFTGRLNLFSALALAGIFGPLMLSVGDITAGLLTKNYSLVHNSISSLALTGIGWLQTIGFLSIGLTVEIFAAGMLFNVKKSRWFHLGIALFLLTGFAMLLIGAFHTDPVGVARTLDGRIHGLSATTAFVLFPFAVLFLIPSIKKDENWAALYSYSGITFIIAVLLIIVTRIVQEGSGFFGLAERLLVANMILWVEVAAIKMFVLSLKRPRKTPPSERPHLLERDTIVNEDF